MAAEHDKCADAISAYHHARRAGASETVLAALRELAIQHGFDGTGLRASASDLIRTRWWADLTDEQRLQLIGQCCTSCGKLDPSCRCGASTRTTVAPPRLHDLLTPTDPDVIGWSPGELLYAEPEIRAKATHVVPLLPFSRPSVCHTFDPRSGQRAPKGLLAVLETPGSEHVSFVVVEWISGPSDEPDGRRTMEALYQPLFHGEGPSGTLRELRHTHWGHAGDGYLHEPNGALITAAFEALKRWFDCWRRS